MEKIRWQVDDAIVALEKEVSLLMFLSQVQVGLWSWVLFGVC